MTKKYIHPKMGWNTDERNGIYYIQSEGYDMVHNNKSVKFTEEQLLNMGFIEAPTEEVKGGWVEKVMNDMEHIKFHIDSRYCDWEQCKKEVRQSIEKHKPMPFDNEYYKQPVEQELIPLDNIDKVIEELKLCFGIDYMPESHLEPTYDTKSMKAILSKYGVHKQEEKTREKCSYCGENHNPIEHVQVPGKIPTPTTQATSVDDLVHKIYVKLYNAGLKLDDTKQQFIKEALLSSLPIVQKKRTRKEVESNYKKIFGYDESQNIGVPPSHEKVLRYYNLLQD